MILLPPFSDGEAEALRGLGIPRVTQGVMYKQRKESCEDKGTNTFSRGGSSPPSQPLPPPLLPFRAFCGTLAPRGRGRGAERSPRFMAHRWHRPHFSPWRPAIGTFYDSSNESSE